MLIMNACKYENNYREKNMRIKTRNLLKKENFFG